jgi:hypothetical protein
MGLMDDGGYVHTFADNNVNGGTTAVYIAGVDVGKVTGNEIESGTAPAIVSSYKTAQGQLTGIGPNVNLDISDNIIASGTQSAVAFVNGSPIALVNNLVSSSATAFVGMVNVYQMNAIGNTQSGTGAMFDSNSTVGFFANGTVGVNVSRGTAELEVNGGVRLNTLKAQPTCSSTTRGEFWFVQGASGVKDAAQVCAKDAANSYAWRTVY